MNHCTSCGNELAPNEKCCSICGIKATSGANQKTKDGAKYFQYDVLPDHAKHKLFSRQNANLKQQIKIKAQGVVPSYAWATILLLWIPFLFYLSDDAKWSNHKVFWVSLLSILDSVLFYRAMRFVVKWHKSVLKCNFYLTPLYFIKTYLNEIWCWGVWTLKDFKVTHNYKNGVYLDSSVDLIFADASEQITLNSEDEVQNFYKAIRYFFKRVVEAQSGKDWQYFHENDDFSDIPVYQPVATQAQKRLVLLQYAFPVCAGILISLGSYYNNLRSSHRYHENVSRESNNQESTPSRVPGARNENNRQLLDSKTTNPFQYNNWQLPKSTELIPQFNEPQKPLPYNGLVKNHTNEKCVAPLKIITKSDMHYYVKIVNWYTNQLVQTIFIRAGGTVETTVPLGSYKIKYAVGETWYGETHRFGPATLYSEAEKKFDFQVIGNQSFGYTIELFLHPDGNLHTKRLLPNEF